MTVKPELLRALEELPQDSLSQVEAFIKTLKNRTRAASASTRNGKSLARKQLFAIKKWTGSSLKAGFSGREHDAVLYIKNFDW